MVRPLPALLARHLEIWAGAADVGSAVVEDKLRRCI